MASRGQQRGRSNGYEIEIIPDGGAGARGSVCDEHGSLIARWSYSGTGEVWVDVGEHKSGTIAEDGHGDARWFVVGL